MAPSTIYQYHMRQDFSTNVDSNNSTAPTTDAIIIHLQFSHVLELCYPETIQIPLNTTNESHLFPRQLFSSHVNRESIVKEILSSMGCSSDFIESAAPDISSFALDMVTNPCNASSSEVLTMVLAIHVTTPYDEREEIDRALSESLMQEASRFKPASKSCIDGLKRMSLEGSCSMKECMVCLEEFLMGSEVVCLPCGHIFHGDCIVRWLETSHLCPLCRFAMPWWSKVMDWNGYFLELHDLDQGKNLSLSLSIYIDFGVFCCMCDF